MTRRKNIWCSSLCPVLLLLRSFWSLVGPWLGCWDDLLNCEVYVVSLVICLSRWFVSLFILNTLCDVGLKSAWKFHHLISQFKAPSCIYKFQSSRESCMAVGCVVVRFTHSLDFFNYHFSKKEGCVLNRKSKIWPSNQILIRPN